MTRWPHLLPKTQASASFAAIAMVLCLAVAAPSQAMGQLLTEYTARIGPQDKVNSQGTRLDTVAAILRQDRANMHRFDLADDDDETDAVFDDSHERGRFERLISRGLVRPDTRSAIINGSPLIRVRVYSTRVDVELLEP